LVTAAGPSGRVGSPNFRFYWRGVPLPAEVPVFNRVAGLTVTAKDAEAYPPLKMYGNNLVYNASEGMVSFFRKVNVAATYIRQGGDATDTRVRSDVQGDIDRGICREFIPIVPAGGAAYAVPAQNGGLTPGEWKRTLYSTNIWNWYNTEERGWAFATPTPSKAMSTAADPVTDGSDLNGTTSTNYLQRDRTVTGRISYTGWAGDPSVRRTVSAGSEDRIAVAPIGYF